jgi:hypothetical protein
MTAKKKANKKPRSREGRNTPGGKNRVRKRTVESERSRSFAGQRSGDVVGLSNVERADSESVEELLEEGNSFEAGVVKAWKTPKMPMRRKFVPIRCLKTMFPTNTRTKIRRPQHCSVASRESPTTSTVDHALPPKIRKTRAPGFHARQSVFLATSRISFMKFSELLFRASSSFITRLARRWRCRYSNTWRPSSDMCLDT